MNVKPDISIEEAKGLIDKLMGLKQFVLLDVRMPDEYHTSRIDGALLIELKDLQTKIKHLNPQPYYLVYCRSGRRSDAAANILRANGFKKVSNMLGGIVAWIGHNYPIVSGK